MNVNNNKIHSELCSGLFANLPNLHENKPRGVTDVYFEGLPSIIYAEKRNYTYRLPTLPFRADEVAKIAIDWRSIGEKRTSQRPNYLQII